MKMDGYEFGAAIDLHVFWDASIIANCPAVYVRIYQPQVWFKKV